MPTPPLSTEQLLAWDREYLWHPYATVIDPPPMTPVSSAHGVRLQLPDGRELIDGMASWWSAVHGYNHPRLNQAAQEQLAKMSHVMFGGITHESAARLGKRLVEITPEGLTKVFLADSGSVAVEVAIKMALQYWASQRQPERHRLMTIRSGYHGDTFGAMATCDPVTGMHHLFANVLADHVFAEQPPRRFHESFDEHALDDFKTKLEAHHTQLAAVILEPIVQGAGGMYFYHPDYLRRVRELCDQYGLLLIADEIATGFGRTGKLFACEHAGISPDILCLGKALTGGYLTLAATLCNDRVARGICEGEAGAFMHGPTFMGNPLACAIANASIELLLEQDWAAEVARLERGLNAGLTPARELDAVADVRVLGAIGVIEMRESVDLRRWQPWVVERGIWVRPFGRNIYCMPPYIMSDDDLAELCAGMVDLARAINHDKD